MTITMLVLLYAAFRLKQFMCDFILQTDWMALNKGMPGAAGYKALLSHAGLHGAGTLVVALIFAPALWWLGLVDVLVHGVVDRLKGVISYKKGWTPTDRWFWWSFGADQEAHNFTHLAYIILIVSISGGLQL